MKDEVQAHEVQALERELRETRRVRDQWCAEYVKVRDALRPFAKNVDAVSLAGALEHVTRVHLLAAAAAVGEAEG